VYLIAGPVCVGAEEESDVDVRLDVVLDGGGGLVVAEPEEEVILKGLDVDMELVLDVGAPEEDELERALFNS